MTTPGAVTRTDVADAVADLEANLADPVWRLSNLYKIIVKEDDEDEGLVVTFKPNRAQRRLLARLHNRNIIIKARQLGFTTLIAILWLDTALWSKSPIRCGIVAHDREAAEVIFRDKVRFAYDHLPDELRERFPLRKETAQEILFAHNGASIRVATSMRSGTIHRLHVSEYGKICAQYPKKAREVALGSIPSVPLGGMVVIESTTEGASGRLYDMSMRALDMQRSQRDLTQRDYRLHFFPWHDDPGYEIDPEGVIITDALRVYFAKVEAKIGKRLSDRKRAWYAATLEADFSGEAPDMWQEYPSYIEEAFQASTEGCYYAEQLARAREQGRVLARLPVEQAPVYSFWDLGRGDMTAIWLMQVVGPHHRFIRYYEASGEELSHYATWLAEQKLIYARHYLPHDAAIKRLGETPDTNRSMKEMLERLMPGQSFEIVPRVSRTIAGIQATRGAMARAMWCEEGTAQGLERLANYRKRWDPVRMCWSDEPMHDDASHGADAIRQWGQLVEAGETFSGGAYSRPTAGSTGRDRFGRRGRSAMAV